MTPSIYFQIAHEDAYHARRDGRMMEYLCSDARANYLVDLELSEVWSGQRCPADPCLELQTIATIGRPLFYFGGAQLDVLQFVRTTDGQGCAAAGTPVAGASSQAGRER